MLHTRWSLPTTSAYGSGVCVTCSLPMHLISLRFVVVQRHLLSHLPVVASRGSTSHLFRWLHQSTSTFTSFKGPTSSSSPFLTSSPSSIRSFSGSCTSLNKQRKIKPWLNKMVDPKAPAAESEGVTCCEVGMKELELSPDFIKSRLELWDEWKKQSDEQLAQNQAASVPITVTFTDKEGVVKPVTGESWKSSPYSIARENVSKAWAESIVIAKVDGKLWDMNRPLEKDCDLKLISFDDPEGKAVFWHSSAHMLGEALERVYGGHLCYGPPIADGYYYDMYLSKQEGDNQVVVSTNHFKTVESVMKNIANERQPFERLELTKAQLLKMFEYNQFKVRILNERVTEDRTTVYRCGPLIDLCLGPHVRHTGCVKSFKVTKTSSSYWEGKAEAEALTRVYGISFPEPRQLKEWENFQAEAAKRDHRKLGREQGLFFFHALSPGSCFFTPKGAHIYNTLISFVKSEYRKRGFAEVISPNMYNSKLWKMSGHWDHYAENMFLFDVEKEQFALKPMNCPGHCLMFDSTTRSWKDLPIRWADFGVLHRNELSGALTGLTRVRRFQQDDAHIFCTHDQIEQEVTSCLDFMKHIYEVIGFTFDLVLSTRPESFLGEIETWNNAEAALANSLDKSGFPWARNEGDGAFYGPKIDITVKDALKRPFQCATIQLDFQLPTRFDLKYSAEDGTLKKPVIIHRAILGSLERFIAILTENFGGKWPFWLSPRQAILVPVGPSCNEYAQKLHQQIHEAGYMVDMELDPGLTLQKKIRNSQLAQYNFILVVGDEEAKNGSVNVRTRDNVVHGEMQVSDLLIKFQEFTNTRILNAEGNF